MKFSYKLIGKYLPGVEPKEDLVNSLTMYALETEDMEGDKFGVSVPSNRYSNIAHHIGLAREAAAILNLKKNKIPEIEIEEWEGEAEEFSLEVKEKNLCPRYTAWYFEDVEIEESPEWIQEILENCGLRPINNVVDIMNYVMLETGQPLHAFDYDKIEGRKIVVRKAKKEEKITSIEGIEYELNSNILLIADKENPLAVAGIKGGKSAEIGEETKRIVVESANFDPVSIYNTSRDINLFTDASSRFAHAIHKDLALVGLKRAGELLEEIMGAKPGGKVNSSLEIESPKGISFSWEKFNSFMGTDFKRQEIEEALERLGFEIEEGKVRVPALRDDIWTEEDLIEEAGRILGFNEIEPKAPMVGIKPSETDAVFLFRDRIRDIMTGFGYDEVYNYSFLGDERYGEVKLENPISEEKAFLRKTLKPLILENMEENLKYYDEVRVFEVGRVFEEAEERDSLGISFGSKKKETFFEVKGAVDGLLRKLGLMDFYMSESDLGLTIHADGKEVGWISKKEKMTLAEINANLLMNIVGGELSFRPLPRFPFVLRDISLLTAVNAKIGDLIQEIQLTSRDLVEDVDLVDEYFGAEDGKQSVTLRIRFRTEDRTLFKEEVDNEMKKITSVLEDKFGAVVR